MFKEGLNTEVGHGGAKEHGSEFAIEDFFKIEWLTCHIEELKFLKEVLVLLLSEHGLEARIIERGFIDIDDGFTVRAIGVEDEDFFTDSIVDALEFFAFADGPVHGECLNLEEVFKFFHELKRGASVAVTLVDKGEDGELTHTTDFEELFCLRLDTFGDVNEHDGGVCGSECTVGILGEVGVARRIKEVDLAIEVLELKNRGGNGDTALFFKFHPVTHGVSCGASALHATCEVNCSTVQEEFFCEGCFTRIGVGDDGEGTSAIDLGIEDFLGGQVSAHSRDICVVTARCARECFA